MSRRFASVLWQTSWTPKTQQILARGRLEARHPDSKAAMKVITDSAGNSRPTETVISELFVSTLGCSRKSVRLLSFKSGSQIWSQLHEEAIRRLGGAPRVVVLDNLEEGALKLDVYDYCRTRYLRSEETRSSPHLLRSAPPVFLKGDCAMDRRFRQ